MEYFIADWTLTPDTGGKFEVFVNDELVFSKKQLGRHAEPGEIKTLLEQKVRAYAEQVGLDWDKLDAET